jgi:hypothetical protein
MAPGLPRLPDILRVGRHVSNVSSTDTGARQKVKAFEGGLLSAMWAAALHNPR